MVVLANASKQADISLAPRLPLLSDIKRQLVFCPGDVSF